MIIHTGYKPYRDSDGKDSGSGQNWWILSLDHDLEEFKYDNPRYQGGPGQPYSGKMCFRHGRRFILATQSCGMDI